MASKLTSTEQLASRIVKGLAGAQATKRDNPRTWLLKVGGKTVAELVARPSVLVLYLKTPPTGKALKTAGIEMAAAPTVTKRKVAASPKWGARFQLRDEDEAAARSLLESL